MGGRRDGERGRGGQGNGEEEEEEGEGQEQQEVGRPRGHWVEAEEEHAADICEVRLAWRGDGGGEEVCGDKTDYRISARRKVEEGNTRRVLLN